METKLQSVLVVPGDLTPHLGYPLVGVFLQGTKDPDPSIRASSLSNLGALCQGLDYSLGPLAPEVRSTQVCPVISSTGVLRVVISQSA